MMARIVSGHRISDAVSCAECMPPSGAEVIQTLSSIQSPRVRENARMIPLFRRLLISSILHLIMMMLATIAQLRIAMRMKHMSPDSNSQRGSHQHV